MRAILISLSLLPGISCFADVNYSRPLWEEDKHFCYYRALIIEGSVSHLDTLIQQAKHSPKDMETILETMQFEVNNCKNALGFPRN